MSLKVKLLVAMVLLSVLPLGVVSWQGIRYFSADKESFVRLLGTELAPVVSSEVRSNVERAATTIGTLADVSSAPYLGPAERKTTATQLFRRSDLIAVQVLQDGQRVLELRDESALPAEKADVVLAALVPPQTPLEPGDIRVTNATRIDGYPVALVAVAHRGAGGQLLGLGLLPVSRILRPSAASTLETWVVDSSGRVLVHPRAERVVARTDVSHLPPVQALREGTTGSREYAGLDGEQLLGSFAPVPVGGLGVIQDLPTEAVFGAVRALVQSAILATTLALVVTLVVAFLIARGVSSPVSQLAATARQIGAGELDAPIPRIRAGELGELAEAFRSMQQGLSERDQKLREAQDALIQSEKMGALGQLAAGITHEVKNPLAGIIGFAQLSLRQVDESSPVVAHLKTIEKESKRAKEILENLLRFARREEVEMIPTDPNLVVLESLKLVAHQLQLSKVQVVTRYGEGLPKVMANLNQLQQVLMNLTMNAAHAMLPKGGRLEVATDRAKSGQVVIEVKDEGHGIKAEDRKRLFTPFFTTKEKGKGTGLGLSVSYGIVQQHQGEIRVWSQEGVGTIFYIYLPTADRFRHAPPTDTD